MQAIVTKFFGPTNFRGSRVKATAQAGSVTVPWDDALNSEDNHDAAAKALARKWGWLGEWHRGAMPDGTGNVYVSATRTEDGRTYHTASRVLVSE